MNCSDEVNFCPKCGQQSIERISDRLVFQEVGWEDGMGSPGTLTHKYKQWICKKCEYRWSE